MLRNQVRIVKINSTKVVGLVELMCTDTKKPEKGLLTTNKNTLAVDQYVVVIARTGVNVTSDEFVMFVKLNARIFKKCNRSVF